MLVRSFGKVLGVSALGFFHHTITHHHQMMMCHAFVVVPDLGWKSGAVSRGEHVMCMSSSLSPSDSNSLPEQPAPTDGMHISIEYCSACLWMLRSTWIASELLTTFAKEKKLASISLIPKSPPLSPGGIFRIRACSGSSDKLYIDESETDVEVKVLWDRSVEGRFPESKEVKQLVRDVVNPDRDLGHSDKKKGQSSDNANDDGSNDKPQVDCIECKERESEELSPKETKQKKSDTQTTSEEADEQTATYDPAFYERNRVTIEYSTGPSISSPDNTLHRATWYSSELLSMVYERNAWWKTHQQERDGSADEGADTEMPFAVDRVTLIPNRDECGVLVSLQRSDMIS
jgi:selenoprotein W-related protein